MKIDALINGAFYHIYNRGNNSCDLFREEDNYKRFLDMYDRYVSPVADTFAWVLMTNHFHLLVRIKKDIVYRYNKADQSVDALSFEKRKWDTMDLSACKAADSVKIPKAHLHFSHLFSAYTKYVNKRYDRTGSLFERPFKRKKIDRGEYLKNVAIYIHQNPVHHGFCEHPLHYPWSSYLTCTSTSSTKLQRDLVLDWFKRGDGFVNEHQEKVNHLAMNQWLQVEPDYYTPKTEGELK